jgi:hypothetical protein
MAVSSSMQLAQSVARLPETDLAEFYRALLAQLPEAGRIELAAQATESVPGILGALRSFLAIEDGWLSIAERIAGAPRRIVDLTNAADDSLRQARIAGEAIAAIWEEELLTSSETALRLGAKPSNREKINSYRRRSILLGLPRDEGRRYLYPAFQLDPQRQEIRPEVWKVNELLDAAADPWGVASWWISLHGRLGSRPMDLVGTAEASTVVRAAEAALEPLG